MARAVKSLVGNKYGRLTVIEHSHHVVAKNGKGTKHYWKCLCECGNEKIVRSDSLTGGAIQSCGCLQKEKASKSNIGVRNDITGKRFGRLVAIKPLKRSQRGYIWLCDCDCGKPFEVLSASLTSGKTTSCGCYSRELSTQRIIEVTKRNVGENHYLYNPNLTDKEREDKRDTKENYQWRNSIYKRDNYKCVKCGENTHDLRAHHIENYKDNPDKRYNIDNGITLCHKCHTDFHRQYGLRNTNRKQLEEFLKENTEVN